MLNSHKTGLRYERPLSRIWKNYYMRLYRLKKFIQNES